ncbi:periplasmic nitrate reductase, NapE protein [Rhodovibrio salinarum]|uniref:Periplasmic nitrate reductase, NapE protein n=1 Tax=Rhodovibrio salinarum TaxID=1087 RepID=A0A934QLV2_9PROT|nr:periplasmic nitrate reductase, NapE protein [Rhodovibrio salinarum]MBK1698900.1 periplasmic nitrate reductase, NapE protein [Rhodovibrio salinarum]
MAARDNRTAAAASYEAAGTTPIRTRFLQGKRGEQFVFALLAVLIWPFVAVGVVGGYGFLVWMYQLLTGPPGPPGV